MSGSEGRRRRAPAQFCCLGLMTPIPVPGLQVNSLVSFVEFLGWTMDCAATPWFGMFNEATKKEHWKAMRNGKKVTDFMMRYRIRPLLQMQRPKEI